MKTLSFLRTNLMLAAAILTAGITMSFKMTENKSAATEHYYISSSMSAGAFRNVSNWSTTNSNGNCVSQLDERPCKITVPEGVALSTVLGTKSNDEVIDISEGYKLEP